MKFLNGNTINVIVKRQASPFAEPYNETFQVKVAERACVLDVLEEINNQIGEQMAAFMMKNGGPGGPGGPGAGGPGGPGAGGPGGPGGPGAGGPGGPGGPGAGPGGPGGPGAGGPNPDMPRPLIFPHSCKVRKCGGCAMRINGLPRLACEVFIEDLEEDDLILEPLSKFPVMTDLVVDKTAFDRMLEEVEIWLHDVPQHDEETYLERFESARCINCGCCLEVCNSYVPDGPFAGPAAVTNMPRIVDELHDGKIRQEYAQICHKHVTDPSLQNEALAANPYPSNLTCADVCPMELPFTTMLARLKSL